MHLNLRETILPTVGKILPQNGTLVPQILWTAAIEDSQRSPEGTSRLRAPPSHLPCSLVCSLVKGRDDQIPFQGSCASLHLGTGGPNLLLLGQGRGGVGVGGRQLDSIWYCHVRLKLNINNQHL